MSVRNKFILTGIVAALMIFPIWRFAIQGVYLHLLGWIVAAMGSFLPYGKSALSTRFATSAGEIAFDLFDFRSTIVVDVSSIVTNIVPLLALVLATPVAWKKRFFGAIIGVGIAFLSHVFATSLILWWRAVSDTGLIESLKVFTDGVLVAALPLLYWAVWADLSRKGGFKTIFSNRK